jgi:flagellar basal-body rod protein FlgB
MSSFIDGDKTIKALQFSLDGLSKRVQVASNDIANADTPNYKASEVTFEGNLRKALRGDGDNPLPLTLTDGAHMDPRHNVGVAAVVETPLLNQVLKNDNNSVDVDREMTTLAESNIMYNAISQMTSTKLGMLRASITETRP